MLVVYKLTEVSLLAGALEALFSLPIGGDVLQTAAKWIPIKGPKGKVLSMVPVELLRLVDNGSARNVDEFFDALKKAGGDDAAAKKALDDFARVNGVSTLVKDDRLTRALLREAMSEVPKNLPGEAEAAAHHIIPVAVFKDPRIGERLHEMGIDLNGADNGVWLPTKHYKDRTASIHLGNHQGALTAADGQILESYAKRTERRVLAALDSGAKRESILGLLDEIRQELLTNEEAVVQRSWLLTENDLIMATIECVYEMSYSIEPGRPLIDLLDHDLEWSDWGDMDAVFPPGVDTLMSPETLAFHVGAPDALEWDCYNTGLWVSARQRFIVAIRSRAPALFSNHFERCALLSGAQRQRTGDRLP